MNVHSKWILSVAPMVRMSLGRDPMRTRLFVAGVSAFGVLAFAGCKHHDAKPATPLPCVNVEECPNAKAGVLTTVPASGVSPITRVLGEAKPLVSAAPKVEPTPPMPVVEPTNRPRDLFVSGTVRPIPEPTPAIVVPLAEPTPTTEVPTSSTNHEEATLASPAVVTTEARSRKAHADDYRWLVGEVSYSSAKKEWRLRYAELGVSDDYGGSVTLTGSGHWFEKLRDGHKVRVEGELMNRTPSIAPPYRVSLLRVVD